MIELATVTRDEGVRRAHAADASGLVMMPDAVARPRETREVAELLREANGTHMPVTPAGGQTSTTAASITGEGILLSLRAMDRIGDVDAAARTVRAESGVLLGDLKRACAAAGLLLPPDPTSEEESTLGGAIACNASGARTLRYGATRPWVRALTVVLANGDVLELRRTELEKNTVGYAAVHDPIDWFVGSEGTLGVVVAAELALLPLPESVTGIAVPFADEQSALRFVRAARTADGVAPRCLEFFDERATAIAGEAAEGRVPAAAKALVYAEEVPLRGAEPALDEWLALAEAHEAIADDVAVYEGEAALASARRMRHAVPARMNERGALRRAHGGRKVSTDWAVPYARLAEVIARARTLADEARIEQAVTYGHAGNGHPHQNWVANDGDELARIERVVEATLREVIAAGGTIAAEHGIGKLKRKWLGLQLTPMQTGAMRALKRELDPAGILAPGNVL